MATKEASATSVARNCVTLVVMGIGLLTLLACQTTSFQGKTPTTANPPAPAVTPTPVTPVTPVVTPPVLTPTPTVGMPCSSAYSVPATGNPYLAGVANGTQITYTVTDNSNPVDVAPANAPVLVETIGSCIQAGQALAFSVSGTIAYNAADAQTNADGDLAYISPHQLGAYLGKSDIVAPLNSLLGVFLGAADPTGSTPPARLDFSTQAERDYTVLRPLVGQIFFIGTGRTSGGQNRQVIVPTGATRLYFAVMDAYQWNNNAGSLTGQILVGAAPAGQ